MTTDVHRTNETVRCSNTSKQVCVSRGRSNTTHLAPFQEATKTKLMHTGVGETFAFHTSQANRTVRRRRLIVLGTLLLVATIARLGIGAATVI